VKTNIKGTLNGTHQKVSINLNTGRGQKSIRIGFTDQRLTAYGGLALWSSFLEKKRYRQRLGKVLPQTPRSPNAYEPTDIALGMMGGILSGAQKLSGVSHLRADGATAEVLGIEAVPSQPTLTRFLAGFSQGANEKFSQLHGWAAGEFASIKGGYTLDLDSWSLLHEDGKQDGVALGHTRKGIKPCHHALIAGLTESKVICGFWLRRGDAGTLNNAKGFLRNTLAHLPHHIRIGLVRADSGFYGDGFLTEMETLGLKYIVVSQLDYNVRKLCNHSEAAWSQTQVQGLEVQESQWKMQGRRVIVIRHRINQRPNAGGKMLLEVPGYRFQALVTNLSQSYSPLEVWWRYNGRADIENRIRELGAEFAIRTLCCKSFWATEAACHLAISAYNLCVLLQRELGLLEKIKLSTLRFRLFSRAAVWSRAQGYCTLKFAIPSALRQWWLQIIDKLASPLPPFNCNSVGTLSA
jgi:hypothetical protein